MAVAADGTPEFGETPDQLALRPPKAPPEFRKKNIPHFTKLHPVLRYMDNFMNRRDGKKLYPGTF